ncbi:MerR family transcriptional regulator [Nocardioides sp. GXZ039]|uniref:MerR family transcriptional regulator n=1 Tax=Nocardioides sp. GXZ039 TaxID=3136018 RepID=UPI0030F3BECB
MADVAESAGVAVATVKYYVREGLVPPGERTGHNQTRYSTDHVRRVRLVRALLELGGLSIAAAKDVLAVIDHPGRTQHQVLGAVQRSVPTPRADDVVATAEALGHGDLAEFATVYADAAERLAALELAWVKRAGTDRQALSERALVGTVLGDALLTAARREAQQAASERGA